MTAPNYTAQLFIIDRSGSMQSIRTDMEGGIDTILKDQIAQDGKYTVDVAYFDDRFDYTTKLADAKDVTVNIVPRGMTALYDAVVRGSNEFGESLASLPEDERPGTVIVTVITDGHENTSRESTIKDVKETITRQQDVYGWNYMFLGANQDAVLTGKHFGLRDGASLTFNASSVGVAFASANTSQYISATRSGKVASFV